jgi:plastocyanin
MSPGLNGAKHQGRWWHLRHRARKLPALVVATVVAGLLVVPGTVQAQQTLNIQAGFPFEKVPGGGMRFYAPELNVHQGDTLTFTNAGFHTATLLPTSVTDVDQWIQDNEIGIDKPFSILQTDPDDTPLDPGGSEQKPSTKFNNAVAFPNPQDCGGEGLPPCEYAGDTLLNSGAFFTTWSATINTTPNTSGWAVCLLHPEMTLKINVVPSGQPTSTQAEIDSYLETQGGADADAALDKHKELSKKHVKKNGKWQAWNGFDGDGYALIAMYPRRLEIKKGQRVEWNFNLLHEPHTVTFPKDKARDFFRQDSPPYCDPDGDDGPGPDNPAETQDPPFCLDPLQVEFDLQAKSVNPYGDGKFRSRDYESSGFRGPQIGNIDSYTLKFTKKSDSKGYKYMCMIHGPFQSGTVEVKG